MRIAPLLVLVASCIPSPLDAAGPTPPAPADSAQNEGFEDDVEEQRAVQEEEAAESMKRRQEPTPSPTPGG